MNISKQVNQFIKNIPEGKIFTYDDIGIEKKSVVAIYLSRLFKRKIINKIAKGKFYKSKSTRFGNLPPDSIEIINTYVKKYNGYITGAYLYNIFGLSTQMPAVIEIAVNKSYNKFSINNLKFKFVSSKIKITQENIKYLQLLDIVKNMKKAPDIKTGDIILFVANKIKNMKTYEVEKLVEITREYNPMVRAVIGAILEDLKFYSLSKYLKNTLNKTTSFKLGISENILPNKKKWKIR